MPSMPECDPPVGFASARATDVRSALLLMVCGLVAAFVIGNICNVYVPYAPPHFSHSKGVVLIDLQRFVRQGTPYLL